MRAAVHIADFGFPGAFRALVAAPKPAKVPGLRSANSGLGAALGGVVVPIPSLKRVVMVSFWDDDASIDAFEASHPAAARFADGWSVRLKPLRAFGTWPGLDTDVAHSRIVEHDGEVVVLTLGRLKLRHSVPFFRASNTAERSVIDADGLRWATGFASPPFVATCSIWESGEHASAYAYEMSGGGHPRALAADRRKGGFHKQSAFIRWHPYAMRGGLRGKNALAEVPGT